MYVFNKGAFQYEENPHSNFSSGKFLKKGCTKTDRWKKKSFTDPCIFSVVVLYRKTKTEVDEITCLTVVRS